MDQIIHISQKMLAERARQQSQQQRSPLPDSAPPPYGPSETSDDSDDERDENPSSPLKLTINAAHSMQGSNNLVSTSPTPLADATKFSAILLHAVNQINNATNASDLKTQRSLKVDLTINCGITVVGDRNVIGNVGLKPKVPHNMVGPGSNAIAGAKRKAEEDSDDEREIKKPNVECDSL